MGRYLLQIRFSVASDSEDLVFSIRKKIIEIMIELARRYLNLS